MIWEPVLTLFCPESPLVANTIPYSLSGLVYLVLCYLWSVWRWYFCWVVSMDLLVFFRRLNSSLSSTSCWRSFLFPVCIWLLYKKSRGYKCVNLCWGHQLNSINHFFCFVLFWVFCFVFLFCLIFFPGFFVCLFFNYNFVVQLDIGGSESSCCSLIVQDCFSCSGFL